MGGAPAAAAAPASGALHAHLDGFDLHAAVAVPAGDRARLEHLCRYVLRPPVAQEALERERDGTLLLRLRRTWRDGTRAVRFSPIELLEKLAAMIPKPRINLLVYHGAFAPNARGRPDAVRRAHEGAADGASTPPSGGACRDGAPPNGRSAEPETQAGMPAQRSAPDRALGSTPPPAPAPPRRGDTRPRHYPWADLAGGEHQIPPEDRAIAMRARADRPEDGEHGEVRQHLVERCRMHADTRRIRPADDGVRVGHSPRHRGDGPFNPACGSISGRGPARRAAARAA